MTLTFSDHVASILLRLTPNTYEPFATLSSDPPTITTGTSATLTGRLVGPQTGEITEVGTRGTWDSTNHRLPVSGHSGLDFYHTGLAVEIHLKSGLTGTLPAWVFVDGMPVTATPDNAAIGAVTFSGDYYVKLTWGAAKRRRIEFFAPHSGSWYDVRTAVGDIIAPTPRKPVVAWVGDSFWSGSTPTPMLQTGCFIASRYLGVECLTGGGISVGGTGYSTAGSFTVFGSATRTAAVAAAQPDLIVLQGSINDDGKATIGADAAAAFAAFQAACPDVPMIVLGPTPTNATSTLSVNRQTNIAAVKAAALANSSVIAFYDECGTAAGVPAAYSSGATYAPGDRVTSKGSVWSFDDGAGSGNSNGPGTSSRWNLETWVAYGTGQVGGTTGDGNRDTLVYSDGIHPSVDGSSAYGAKTAQIVRDALPAYLQTASEAPSVGNALLILGG